MAEKVYDQYHPTPEHTTPGPLDSCRTATQKCISLFGLPMRLEGGISTHLGGGVYGVAHPENVEITTEDELIAHLFAPMFGAVRLIVRGRRIEVFGCAAGRRWEVA